MKIAELIDDTTIFVDVRTPDEYQEGHIPGALNIPLPDIFNRKQEIRGLGEKPVIFYCRSGSRSGMAVSQLQKEGYKEIYNGGGIAALQSALLEKGNH
ncbi:rhodanese-like domain-containing protein [Chitinophaga pollutisoli]|uniref:Rhodanese-like domain-containing protein n=1 Tax=Chitinophaga pollutisoli TaxID=3133966 RepID=A0ABZ2YU34_9BACT